MAAGYKLTYYNSQGLAEPIRYIFALKKIPFEDVRLREIDDLGICLRPEYHQSPPYHRIPALEFDGKTLTQSTSILRYLGRKYGLCGKDEFEAAKCDQYLESTRDFVAYFCPAFEEKDANKRNELLKSNSETVLPCYMSILNDFLTANGGKYFVGSELSIADIYICHTVSIISQLYNQSIYEMNSQFFKEFPLLQKVCDNFFDIVEIMNYIEERPNRESDSSSGDARLESLLDLLRVKRR